MKGDRARALSTAELAWLALPPCAVALLAAILWLGEPLGAALEPSRPPATWDYSLFVPLPEPTEHARFLLALLGPLLLSGAVLAAVRRRPALPPLAAAVLRHGAEALLVAFLVACVVAQRTLDYGPVYGGAERRAYFTTATLAVAGLLGALLLAAIASRRASAAIARAAAETPWRARIAFLLAALATALWLLTAVQLDRSAGGTNGAVTVSMPFWLSETYAVLNGRTPLVDFTAQYSNLWPFVAAAAMSLLGTTLGVYTIAMASGSLVALLAAFGVLRRAIGSSLLALAAYLPFLATGFFMQLGPLENRYGPSNLLSMFPMRYGGAYLLAWLTARHVDGTRPRRAWALFAFGGVVVLANPEFGVAAAGATLAALVWTLPRWSRAAALRLLGRAALGTALGAGLVALALALRAGALPDPAMLTYFPRLYAVTGFGMLPMPAFGFHLALYATFAAALVVATVRSAGGRRDVLTAMLAWSGAFGLGASGYFAGRSHPEVLIDLFSIWALALVLLLVAAARAIQARPTRRPTLAELAVLVGVGIAACSIAQTPTPWSQVERLTRRGDPAPFYADDAVARFVARTSEPGERVAIVAVPGHWVAEDAGVVNVGRYAGWESMPLREQLQHTIDALEREGGRRLYMPSEPPGPGALEDLLRGNGLTIGRRGGVATEYVDRD